MDFHHSETLEKIRETIWPIGTKGFMMRNPRSDKVSAQVIGEHTFIKPGRARATNQNNETSVAI